MSTFDGLIREFPTVAIDNFKIRPGNSSIYCSQITAKWLPMLATRAKQTMFESGQDKKPLATDVPHYLDLGNGRRARLSLIPAHHCPGAVMFLLQDDQSCILYTGDARNEALDLQGLSTMPIFSSSTQRIHRLYLDTTYCHQEFQAFPSREFIVSDLVTFINRRPRLAHYYIDAWTFGYEDIWIGLSKAFNTKIHVSPYFYELYKAIDDMISPKILPYLTLDGTTARFHSCRLGSTCGYGGAGGEHSSARELIRIQPNVIWFSAMQRAARKSQCETTTAPRESVVAQGKTIQRSNSFKTKEKLPPSIAKKDDLCYYINYSFHASLSELRQLVKIVSPRTLFPCVLHRDGIFNTFYRSNREVVTLLAQDMPEISFSLDVEEYNDRRPCISDGITTDFQSFHNAKGFNILDMDDRVLGIASTTTRSSCQRSEKDSGIIVLDKQQQASSSNPTARKVLDLALSPRSNHLLKKMEKLKRQLRSTASLEEEGVQKDKDESVLEEGPLSLDLEAIEKKRKWWLEYDRGKSTTQEEDTTGGEETDPQISKILSGELTDSIIHGGENDSHVRAVAGDGYLRDGNDNQSSPQAREEWNELSTLELNPPSTALVEIDESNFHTQPDSRSEVDSNSIRLSSSPDPIYSSKSMEPLDSGPTAYHGSSSAASIPSPDPSVHSTASPAPSQANSVVEAAIASKESAASSLPSPRTQTPVNTEYISISSDTSFSLSATSPSHNAIFSLPPLPKTPPRSTDVEIDLGASPSSSRRPNSMRFAPPFNILRPIGNIFAQLAWSPPLRPVRKQSRAKTEPHHGIGREFKHAVSSTKRAASTIVVDEEEGEDVIVIESSDDDGIRSNNFKDREGRRMKKMKETRELESFQMERNASLDNDSQDVNLLEYQELEFDGSNSFVL
ncbi:hypothetical protein BGX26_012460 [Mortierella sp. AD094]|nr:hypothetical protein BGX26_012460 [Mortierella sp. AD094]